MIGPRLDAAPGESGKACARDNAAVSRRDCVSVHFSADAPRDQLGGGESCAKVTLLECPADLLSDSEQVSEFLAANTTRVGSNGIECRGLCSGDFGPGSVGLDFDAKE